MLSWATVSSLLISAKVRLMFLRCLSFKPRRQLCIIFGNTDAKKHCLHLFVQSDFSAEWMFVCMSSTRLVKNEDEDQLEFRGCDSLHFHFRSCEFLTREASHTLHSGWWLGYNAESSILLLMQITYITSKKEMSSKLVYCILSFLWHCSFDAANLLEE